MTAVQLQLLMLFFAGWVNCSQQDVIEYLQAENRVLREQLGDRRLLLTDGQRRRLARRAKAIGRKGLFEISTQVLRSKGGVTVGGVTAYYEVFVLRSVEVKSDVGRMLAILGDG